MQCAITTRFEGGAQIDVPVLLLLLTNLAQEWLQIDTDLLRIVASTADELPGGTNVGDLE